MKPEISTADVVVSSILLVLTVLGGAFGAFMGLFMLAFTDNCPPATCSIDGAVSAIMIGVGLAAVIAVVGITLTIVALVRRTRGWPFALGTCVLVGVSCIGGIVGYLGAVGGI